MAKILTVNFTIGNKAAVDALVNAVQLVHDAAAELPWRDDLREAERLLKQAAAGMMITIAGRG